MPGFGRSLVDFVGRGVTLQLVDGDIFGRVSRIGRQAAEAALYAEEGGHWDPFWVEKCVDVLVAASDGIQALPGVLDRLARMNETPLLARLEVDAVCQDISAIVGRDGKTILDLMLRDAAQKVLLRGQLDARTVVREFVRDALKQAVVYAKGSPVARGGAVLAQAVCERIAPVADRAADVLMRRPDAKRLGLARNRPRITAATNLLEGAP